MSNQNHWVVRLMYNNNPFYLLSGLLVLFTLFSISRGESNLHHEPSVYSSNLWLACSMFGYAAFMALTAICVVRIAKVWEDARTIYLVVVLTIVGMSVVFDQLCVVDFRSALSLLSAGFVFSVILVEVTLRNSKLRLPLSFRVPFFAILAVFFATPLALAGRIPWIEHWGDAKVLVFPVAVSIAMLSLLPAVRLGRVCCEGNGSPWKWPIFPWSLFAILFVAVLVRANALAVSFGPADEVGLFLNPVFFVPIMIAVSVITMEIAVREQVDWLRLLVLFCSPTALILALIANSFPFQANLVQNIEHHVAPLAILVGWSLVFLFGYFFVRGVAGARMGLSFLIAVLSIPTAGIPFLQNYTGSLIALASIPFLIELTIASIKRKSELDWISAGVYFGFWVGSISLLMLHPIEAFLIGSAFVVSWMLVIGVVFDTELMKLVRGLAAICIGLGSGVIVFSALFGVPNPIFSCSLSVSLTLISVAYWRVTYRQGWRQIAFWNGAATTVVFLSLMKSELRVVASGDLFWPILAGIVFFLVAILITSIKAGVLEVLKKWRNTNPNYLPGF